MKNKKMFVIRKFVMAKTASEAIRIEKRKEVDEVYLQDDYFKCEVNDSFAQKSQPGFKRK